RRYAVSRYDYDDHNGQVRYVYQVGPGDGFYLFVGHGPDELPRYPTRMDDSYGSGGRPYVMLAPPGVTLRRVAGKPVPGDFPWPPQRWYGATRVDLAVLSALLGGEYTRHRSALAPLVAQYPGREAQLVAMRAYLSRPRQFEDAASGGDPGSR